MDTRIKKLSKLLVEYSCNIQKGEKVLISYEGIGTKPLIKQLIKDVYAAGGFPYVEIRDSSITREILLGAEEEQIAFRKEYELAQMKGMQAYYSDRKSACRERV